MFQMSEERKNTLLWLLNQRSSIIVSKMCVTRQTPCVFSGYFGEILQNEFNDNVLNRAENTTLLLVLLLRTSINL